ncbi:MAG: prolyl oligopeptidase family serine peptidase [Tunicatimonas sp.]|uniref:alpha/beta hydrolase family protein n=1 Tax=Tunicatimonas sp. TaxID=1940096 RepID=UPI003C73F393
MKLWLIILGWGLLLPAYAQNAWQGFKLDSVQSPVDEKWQAFYYWKAQKPNQPLVVVLHTWSGNYTQTNNSLANQTKAKGWNYIHPNFRGPNNHPEACGSKLVITDIDQAIDWTLENLPVNPDSIFVLGASGGGYATLVTYMKSRHRIRSFHAYVPISDLAAWYEESLVRNSRYARNILDCTASEDSTLNIDEAKRRSPLYWETPWSQRKNATLHLYAGVHDGYTGSVPITQSINFYNKVLHDARVPDSTALVSDKTIIRLLTQQRGNVTNQLIGDRKVHLQKSWQNISLTIFEGGHELLENVALEML